MANVKQLHYARHINEGIRMANDLLTLYREEYGWKSEVEKAFDGEDRVIIKSIRNDGREKIDKVVW